MTTSKQKTRAVQFREMHCGPSMLVLPNAWDAASARIFEQAGFRAIATTRVSFGSGMMRAVLARLRHIAHELLERGTYSSMVEEMLSGAELGSLFK